MPALEKWTPLHELDLMERRMRRFFEEFGLFRSVTPAADVFEGESELVVELEVPGFDESELQIDVLDHTLSVKGVREEETEKKEGTLRLHERLEQEFERRFELPAGFDTDGISAKYDKGVLTVRVPTDAEHRPHRVEINA
jgi:HSP20 family protein